MKKILGLACVLFILSSCGSNNPITQNPDNGGAIPEGNSNQIPNPDTSKDPTLEELGEIMKSLTEGKIEIANLQTYLEGKWKIKAFSLSKQGQVVEDEITFKSGTVDKVKITSLLFYEKDTLWNNLKKVDTQGDLKQELCKVALGFQEETYLPRYGNSYFIEELIGKPLISYQLVDTGFNPILQITAKATHYPACCSYDEESFNNFCIDPEKFDSSPKPFERTQSYIIQAANENAFVIEANEYYVVLVRL